MDTAPAGTVEPDADLAATSLAPGLHPLRRLLAYARDRRV